MKFLVTKSLHNASFFKYLIGFLSLFIILFLMTDSLLHHLQIGLTLEKASFSLFGNEEEFLEPLLFSSLLLQVHIDLFLSMFVVFVTLVSYIRLYEKSKYLTQTIHIFYLVTMASSLSLLLSYFMASNIIIFIWIILFISWHIMGLYLNSKILWKIIRL